MSGLPQVITIGLDQTDDGSGLISGFTDNLTSEPLITSITVTPIY